MPTVTGRAMQVPAAGGAFQLVKKEFPEPGPGHVRIRVQACGDAHLMNFGGFATPERNIFFDINDFDETLPAPWEWDVKRLTASIVIAARHLLDLRRQLRHR